MHDANVTLDKLLFRGEIFMAQLHVHRLGGVAVGYRCLLRWGSGETATELRLRLEGAGAELGPDQADGSRCYPSRLSICGLCGATSTSSEQAAQRNAYALFLFFCGHHVIYMICLEASAASVGFSRRNKGFGAQKDTRTHTILQCFPHVSV